MTVLGPGSLVRCVNVSAMNWPPDVAPLVLGHVYRVRRVWTVSHPSMGSLDVLTLMEYPDIKERKYWFLASRFVPVDDGAISVFRDLLAPAPRERTREREKEKA